MLEPLFDLNSYDYNLPEDRIAQTPAVPRDSSRLLVWHAKSGEIEHRHFCDILEYFNPEDLLILNNTRVIPARLNGNRLSGGKVEILLLNPAEARPALRTQARPALRTQARPALRTYNSNLNLNLNGVWRVLVKPGRKVHTGAEIKVGDRIIKIVGEEPDGVRLAKIGENNADIFNFLEKFGSTPLPPYIHSDDANKWREAYQTVFASENGSAAAPTASLHFTQELLDKIKNKSWVTLHVGLGTFRPVKTQDIREHLIHKEYCEIPDFTEQKINECRVNHGRVIASGTTAARTLEALKGRAGSLNTDLFIYPGFKFNIINALITNFHLPKSSLMMLVAAFAANLAGEGSEDLRPYGFARKVEERALAKLIEIYTTASDMGYRFFSFGDAMLII